MKFRKWIKKAYLLNTYENASTENKMQYPDIFLILLLFTNLTNYVNIWGLSILHGIIFIYLLMDINRNKSLNMSYI